MSDLSPVWFVIYRIADGLVIGGGQMPADRLADYPEEAIPAGAAILEVDREPNLRIGEWVDDGALVEPATISPTVSGTTLAADGVETVTITGLPNPVYVTITHSAPSVTVPTPATEVTDTEVEISTTQTGTITVRIEAPGKSTWEGVIDAV